MNIASIQWPVFTPYNRASVEIYISGCTKKCKGCHNLELQDFSFGKKLDLSQLGSYLKEREDLFEIISFTGGDLLDSPLGEILSLLDFLRVLFSNKEFWLFTGWEFTKIPFLVREYFGVIKSGVYNEDKKQVGFPASTNQKIMYKGQDY
jgi:anaerobic ribonucleoside-triphosphate reductase activating protein